MPRAAAGGRGDEPVEARFKSWAAAPTTRRAVEAAGAIARAPLPPRSASQDIMSPLSPCARPSLRAFAPRHVRISPGGRRRGGASS